jgi:hypothetical protein
LVKPSKLLELKQDSNKGILDGWQWELIGQSLVYYERYNSNYMRYYYRLTNLKRRKIVYDYFASVNHSAVYGVLKDMAETLIFNHR